MNSNKLYEKGSKKALTDPSLTIEEHFDIVKNHYNKLYEGLIKSYPYDKMLDYLEYHKFDFEPDDFAVNLTWPMSPEHIARFKSDILNKMGWFVSYPKDDWESSDEGFIRIEQKYPRELDEHDYPNVMYHISPRDSRESILAIGLTPKSRNKLSTHQDGVYFATSERAVRDIAMGLAYKEFDCWKILKEKMSNYRWFVDPNFLDKKHKLILSVFTKEPIKRYDLALMNQEEKYKIFGN